MDVKDIEFSKYLFFDNPDNYFYAYEQDFVKLVGK